MNNGIEYRLKYRYRNKNEDNKENNNGIQKSNLKNKSDKMSCKVKPESNI